MSNDALASCPFCGRQATCEYHVFAYEVHCLNVKCSGFSEANFDSEAEAIAAWNKRAASRPVGEWMPVEDGMIYLHTEQVAAEWNYPAHTESIEFLEVRDNGDTIAIGSMPKEDEHTGHLPRSIRLCKRVDAPQPVAMPVADWANAPEWANYWAIDPDCAADWWESEPQIIFDYWAEGGRWERNGFVNLPLGVDWRQTLQRRPEQDA